MNAKSNESVAWVTWCLTENQLTENQLTEKQLTENQLTENQLTEKQLTENQLTENHLTDKLENQQQPVSCLFTLLDASIDLHFALPVQF